MNILEALSGKKCFRSRMLDNINYDSKTGVFTWDKNSKRTTAGKECGCIDKDGYIIIKFENKSYRSARLAWFIHYGYWPKDQIDHKNRNKKDNRICNLRECTRSQNSANIKNSKKISKTKRGVFYCNRDKMFIVNITKEGKKEYSEYFKTEQEARDAYKRKHVELHGKFSPYA
jgi:hypothetical protein